MAMLGLPVMLKTRFEGPASGDVVGRRAAALLRVATAKLERVSPRLCERRAPGVFTGVATAFLRRAASILAMRARFAAPESGGCSGMAAPA